MVRINGVDVDVADTNLQDYLLKEGYRPERIAVERNGQIVPRSTYGDVLLKDGDSLEIVHFVGGG